MSKQSLKALVRSLIAQWEWKHHLMSIALAEGNLPAFCMLALDVEAIERDLLTCGIPATPRHAPHHLDSEVC